MSAVLSTAGLFVLTALAEIVGCYLPYLWLRKGASAWLLVPGPGSYTHLTLPTIYSV